MKGERGFTLVEVLITLGALGILGMGVASGVVSGHEATQAVARASRVESRSTDFMSRFMSIPFGTAVDPAATSAELNELFDDDEVFGAITLHKLRAFGPAEFTLADGAWSIVVNHDLDGDGTVRALDDEGRQDLLRITISFDGEPVAHAVRFDPVGTP